VNYAKLLEISSFFTWHIFLEVGKTQDMPSKICQTAGNALSSFFTWHIFLEVGEIQNMPSKIWQTLGDALSTSYF